MSQDLRLVFAAAREDGSGDTGEFVGKGDREHVAVKSLRCLLDPRPQALPCRARSPRQDDVGSLHEQRPQVPTAKGDGSASRQRALLRYVQAKLSMAAQTAACNRLHALEQRSARWLLSARDRAERDTFPMTHEFLSMMLGVRRAGVTVAAQGLQSRALIAYHHGTITILDREGLEACSCECYRAIQDEFNRLLGSGS